ncbi:MAG: peptidoglycan DD-metalloendopeptidase family protein [Proteobacteria bacterium]|nr:peptidoglycan DD-metalloendopeptidase family protein [Pseudomonadota bacterium]
MLKNRSLLVGSFIIVVAFVFSGYDFYQKKLFKNALQKEESLSFVEKDVLTSFENDCFIKIQKKDTLKSILKAKGMSEQKIAKLIKVIKAEYGDVSLKENEEIYLTLNSQDEGFDLDTLKFKPVPECEITITKNAQNADYTLNKTTIELTKQIRFVQGEMTSSFFNSVKGSGLPLRLVKSASVALGYVINFQHDLKKGDSYQFLYEVFINSDGKVVKDGSILYMSMNVKGKDYSLYAYNSHGKKIDYFTKTGEGVVRGFLQTPLDGRRVRVTSGFTLKGRMHPIKGFCRAHKGVDFGAPYGTSVLAAADGTVIQSGYDGDYGNKITLSHSGGYKTVYAHLSKIKVKKGDRVKQRQVIGNVGATGLATGPHLHYESIINNVHVNPMGVKQLPMQKLSGTELKKFKDHVFKIEKELEKQNPPMVTIVNGVKKA